ncbi:hypothetical protein [Arenicella xantha]|nr:hypothetical protein [Arenicella xantha]
MSTVKSDKVDSINVDGAAQLLNQLKIKGFSLAEEALQNLREEGLE